MTTKPRVSVYLSSYNHEKFLRESIDSILTQTYKDFELYIKDDASTDSSWEIITSYSDPRIRAVRNAANQYWGFNSAYPELKGEYIAVHHSDDVWEPGKLEKQVDYLDAHPDRAAVFTHVKVIGEDSQPLASDDNLSMHPFDQPNRTRHEWLRYFFYSGNALCHPSMLIRRSCHEAIGLYRYGMMQLFDLDMWVRVCLHYDIHILQEPLMRFRIRAGNANVSSPRLDSVIRHNFEIIEIIRNYFQIKNIEDLLKVFPEAEVHINREYFNPQYTLAMLMLENTDFPGCQLLGLQTLFEIMNDENQTQQLKEFYHLDTLQFKKLCTSKDVFAFETKNLIPAYAQSKSWKITKPLRDVGDLLRKIKRIKS